MITLKSMYENLDLWVFNKMGDDIYMIPDLRPEYKPLVTQAKNFGFEGELITKYVLLKLKDEIEKPFYAKNISLRLHIILTNLSETKKKLVSKIIYYKIKLKHLID
jgi:hypothetical protein